MDAHGSRKVGHLRSPLMFANTCVLPPCHQLNTHEFWMCVCGKRRLQVCRIVLFHHLPSLSCWKLPVGGCVLFSNKPVQHIMWSWNVARWTIHRSLWPCPSFNRVWWPKAIPILPSIYPQLYRYGWSTKQTNQKNIKPWGLPWFELCTRHNPTCWCWNPMRYNEFPLNHCGSWLNLNKSLLLTVESH